MTFPLGGELQAPNNCCTLLLSQNCAALIAVLAAPCSPAETSECNPVDEMGRGGGGGGGGLGGGKEKGRCRGKGAGSRGCGSKGKGKGGDTGRDRGRGRGQCGNGGKVDCCATGGGEGRPTMPPVCLAMLTAGLPSEHAPVMLGNFRKSTGESISARLYLSCVSPSSCRRCHRAVSQLPSHPSASCHIARRRTVQHP